VRTRWRRNSSGSIGCLPCRSASQNPAPAATPPASRPSVAGERQPAAPPVIRPAVSSPSAAAAATCPAWSSGTRCRGVSGTCARASQALTTPTGTLIRKMLRQPNASISTPPTRGPAATEIAPAATQATVARSRSARAVNRCGTRARVAGSSAAAPAPCTARAAMSQPMPGALAHAAEAAVNTAIPPSSMRRSPIRSPSAPAVSSSAASGSVYPSRTHCAPAMELPRSWRMVGMATFSTLPSRMIAQ
jgi:hypothetical protein